jgi:hypothetical protein
MVSNWFCVMAAVFCDGIKLFWYLSAFSDGVKLTCLWYQYFVLVPNWLMFWSVFCVGIKLVYIEIGV